MAGNYISKSKKDFDNVLDRHAWISRESPEGGCVIINDTSSQTRLLEEILKQKRTVTAYEGYLVNEEDNLDPIECSPGKSKMEDDFPLEIVELPAEPDGKHVDVHFVREGNLDEATQTPCLKPEDIDCGVSVRSMSSDRQQWSFSLYNFEDNGRISREDLSNLVRSIYDALGKSVGKANKKNPRDPVKKVKVHISVSKEKQSSIMRGASVVPRREVVIGAEDETEKQLEQLQLKESPGETATKRTRKRKEKEERYSTVQVLNNDLGKVPLHSTKCTSCLSPEKRDNAKSLSGHCPKNNNLLADRTDFPARRQTGPGECIAEPTMGVLPQDPSGLTDKKNRPRSHRQCSRRRPTYPGQASPRVNVSGRTSSEGHSSGNSSPVAHVSGYSSPVGHVSGYTSSVSFSGVPRNDVLLDPCYAYHTEDKSYLYVHATPRHAPFEEPKPARRRRSRHRKPRDGGENPEAVQVKLPQGTAVVHRHEHVHHHYHHYGEKR